MTDIASQINNILNEYLKGDKQKAYLKLKRISKNYPSNEKLQFNLAFMEQDQGDINSAKKSYIKLINEFNNFNSKLNLYNIFIKEKNYYKSLELINDILNTNKDLINVWIDKAYINYKIKSKELLSMKKVERRSKTFKKIEGFDPANNAGTKLSSECTFILTEGLSAKTYAVKGIQLTNELSKLVDILKEIILDISELDYKTGNGHDVDAQDLEPILSHLDTLDKWEERMKNGTFLSPRVKIS